MLIISIKHSVSHVLFLSTQTAKASYDQVVIIYLHITNVICPSIRSIPFRECPYHNLGFSLMGFTSFHLISFLISSVTVALSGSVIHIRRLRTSFRRQREILNALPYFFSKHEHYGHLRAVWAWTFLYTRNECSDYSIIDVWLKYNAHVPKKQYPRK